MLCCTSWHCCNWTNCGPTVSRSETIGRSPFDRQGFQGFQGAPIALGAQRLWMLEVSSMSWLRRNAGSWDKGSPFQATGSMRPWWDHDILRTVPGTMAGNLEASPKIIKMWDQTCRFGTSGCRIFQRQVNCWFPIENVMVWVRAPDQSDQPSVTKNYSFLHLLGADNLCGMVAWCRM